jgi:hypothetical protein
VTEAQARELYRRVVAWPDGAVWLAWLRRLEPAERQLIGELVLSLDARPASVRRAGTWPDARTSGPAPLQLPLAGLERPGPRRRGERRQLPDDVRAFLERWRRPA